MFDLVYYISIHYSGALISLRCSLTIIPATEVLSISTLLCPLMSLPVLGISEPLPEAIHNLSLLACPLPIEAPTILTCGMPLGPVEVLNGLVNPLGAPNYIIGQYIDEPIENIAITTQYHLIGVTINDGITYIFNKLDGRLLRDYRPEDFAGANWVEDALREQLAFL